MIKNWQDNLKKSLDDTISTSINSLTTKLDKELREQNEYIRSLHHDMDEMIKRAKRDRSDNYIDINKLTNQLKVVEIRSEKIEESVIKSSGLYMGILESIKMHLHLLQQKEQRTIGISSSWFNLFL